MCGRYASYLPPDELRALFQTANAVPNTPPSWNKAPTQQALVVRRHPETGERHLDALRWGLIPHWTKDPKAARQPINARSETAGTSPMFKGALQARRCLVPADALYEWRAEGGKKQPFAVARQDGQPFAFAGLWEGWRDPHGDTVRSFAILPTDANPAMREIHDRMPVVVERADWPAWLGLDAAPRHRPPGDRFAMADGEWQGLMRPSRAALRVWPVSTRVNSPRNDGPELLQPAEAPAGAGQGAPNSA